MLAFLLSPPCDDEPRSIGEARRLAPLRLEGGIPAAGLDGKQKRRWTLFFPSILPGTRQVPERVTAMGKIPRLVLWLCRKFTRQDLQELVHELQEILAGRQPEPQPRDDFRQQHPHYRDFYVDPLVPLTQPPPLAPPAPTLDWQQLRAQYQRDHGRPCLRCGGVAAPARCHPPVVVPTAAHPRRSSTSTMVARPAN